MKKIKEAIALAGIFIAPIFLAGGESKQAAFWGFFILIMSALLAYDAGMLDIKPKKYGKQNNHQGAQHTAKK